MLIIPKLIHRFSAIIKILADYLNNIDNLILNVRWKSKGIRIAKAITKVKNKIRGIILLIINFKTYYKATVIIQSGISQRIDT